MQKGLPITVLAVCEDRSISNWFELEAGEEEGVEHLIIYYNYPFWLLKFFFKAMAFFRGLRFLEKKKGTFDLIHVQVLIDAGFIAWLNFLWKKTPYLITEHSTVFIPTDPFKYPKILKPWIKNVIKKSKYVLPVSNDLAFHMKKLCPQTPFKVIPNVVDTDLFLPPKKEAKKEKIKFLHISNFKPQKNIEGLLRGFKKLSEQRNDFSITFAGDGDLESVKKYATSIQIPSEIIFFHGKMSERAVAKAFYEHDAFVLFSNYENLPCVLVDLQ